MSDNVYGATVDHPAHYTAGKVETIDSIESAVTGLPPFEAYLVGNILKYVSRYSRKNGMEDLSKAAWYLDRLKQQYSKRDDK